MTDREFYQQKLLEERQRNEAVLKRAHAENKALFAELRKARAELEPLRKEAIERAHVEDALSKSIAVPAPAPWTLKTKKPDGGPGIPTLLLSDLHINETVIGSQILGANSFSPEEGRARLRECFETAVDLGKNHMVKPSYDGCVIPVAGDLLDLLGGFLHTSERAAYLVMMDAAAGLADMLEPGFRLMADAYGNVYSPWVTGNHGRLTVQMPFQDRSAKSLDAAVYYILEGRLRGDKRFKFELAPGPRLIYSIGEYRYLLLHGDPASGMPRGGDSEAGPPNVVARGVKRLRSLHLQLGLPFDTAVMGHYHMRMVLPGAIVNGSLKGFDEYASGRSFPYEAPQQMFWFTHRKYGITAQWPIYVGRKERK